MSEMRVRFMGYVPEKLPSGEVRHRVRVQGQPSRRMRIPVGPDDPSFTEHYHAARMGQTVEDATPVPKTPGTLDARVAQYLTLLEAQVAAGQRDVKTLKQRQNLLLRACEFLAPDGKTRMGSTSEHLPRAAMIHIRDSWGTATSQADNCIKAMRMVYAEWEGQNPAQRIPKVHRAQGGATAWSAADVRKFMDAHPDGSTARLWLLLAMWTGARISDLVIIGRDHEIQRGGITWIDWKPGKRGSAPASMPLAPQLVEQIAAQTVIGKTYLLNSYGRPFKNGPTLAERVRRWTSDAGLERRSSHGLRKALATLLAESGASSIQIAAVLSHTSPKTSEIYHRSAARARLSADAIQSVQHIRF